MADGTRRNGWGQWNTGRTAASLLLAGMLTMASVLACALQGDYPAPSLGVVVDAQFTVLHVKAGSAAERGGVEVGDVLVSLDGMAWTTLQEWTSALGRIEAGQEYNLVVQRGAALVSLTLIARRPASPLFPENTTPTPIPAGEYYF